MVQDSNGVITDAELNLQTIKHKSLVLDSVNIIAHITGPDKQQQLIFSSAMQHYILQILSLDQHLWTKPYIY